MAVYIDHAGNKFGRMIMCHMLADTVAELHVFAANIGMRREWFQAYSRPHYDLSRAKRAEAVRAGAVELGRTELVAMMQRQRPVWVAEYEAARASGLKHP